MWRGISDLLSLWLLNPRQKRARKPRIQKEQPSPESNEQAVEERSPEYSSRIKDAPSQSQMRKELLKEQAGEHGFGPGGKPDGEWLAFFVDAEHLGNKSSAIIFEKGDPESARETYALCCNLFELLDNYAKRFNALVGSATLKISLTPPSEVSERRSVAGKWQAVEQTQQISYLRWRASTRSWSLSCRARESIVEIFLIPVSDAMLLSGAEQSFRQRLRVELVRHGESWIWTNDGLPVDGDDLRVHIRQFFKELIRASQDHKQPIQDLLNNEPVGSQQRLAQSINQLLLERQNLAQKVVIQQEEIQKRIARDLHDAVISDVMALKRSLSSDKPLAAADTIKSLEAIVQHLREVCYELSPRDLADWGLSTVIEDILEHMAQRTGADCLLNCDVEIPLLPGVVELHIYRIVQELLNNIEKYAQATRVVVTIDLQKKNLLVTVSDNGKGFSVDDFGQREDKSGYGMSSLRERTELISCFYPAHIDIQSEPGKGSKVVLEIDLSGQLA